jgi:hypothetical protein
MKLRNSDPAGTIPDTKPTSNSNEFLKRIFIFCLTLVLGICFHQPASADKILGLSRDVSVNNTGTGDAGTAILDLTLEGADDVNGLVFTLVYDPDIFAFDGLLRGDMDIDDGSGYDPRNPPPPETIATTLYYQVNNRESQGIVMIAAAAAGFFTTGPDEVFTAFRVRFKVHSGKGEGSYPIQIQKTIIGPDTAANAGYAVPTRLAAAAGLAPDADPQAARTHEVLFQHGLITVSGGYKITGMAVYGGSSEENVTNGTANLIKVSDLGEFNSGTWQIAAGTYSFSDVPAGTYKIEILANRPGFQKRHITAPFDVAGQNVAVEKIALVPFQPRTGIVTIHGGQENITGLRVEIRDGTRVIATVAVDAAGGYVTPPLESPLSDTVKIYAVYGNQEIEITNDPAVDWTDLVFGSVSGTVAGLCDGQLVEVMVRSEAAGIQKSVMITGDPAGNDYTLPHLLPADDYILSAVGEAVAVFYDEKTQFRQADPVAVAAGSDAAGKDFAFVCSDMKTISGHVTEDGTPVAGVLVKANNFDFADWQFGSAVTDAAGEFEIKVAPADDYLVYVELNSRTYYHKTGESAVTVRSAATRVDVTVASEPQADIQITAQVPDTAGLEGYVTLNRSRDNGGNLLADFLVVLLNTNYSPAGFFGRTDENGYYAFENVPPGTYHVTLRPPLPYPARINQGVVLVNDAVTRSDFVVDQYFRVTGAVKDSADWTTPVAGARVDILTPGGEKIQGPAYTGSAGTYTLYDIPSGVYTLAAGHPEYLPEENEGVPVVSNMTAADILMTRGAVISGIVSDTGGPVINALVTLRGPQYVKTARTGSDGGYRFQGLAANTPHIIKAAGGNPYAPYDPDDVTTGNAGSTTVHNMTLIIPSFTWSFTGRVMQSETPVKGAYVQIHSTATQFRKVVRTNAAGGFTFENVIQGTDYSLLVLPGKGQPEILETGISITADTLHPDVTVSAPALISGTVTLSEAGPGANIIAGAYDPAANLVHQVRTHNPGGDLRTFTYSIQVTAGKLYKVFAQDLSGTFAMKYHAAGQDQTSGTYDQATDVPGGTADVNMTLTR